MNQRNQKGLTQSVFKIHLLYKEDLEDFSDEISEDVACASEMRAYCEAKKNRIFGGN
jgi:hypothetical protein